MKGKTEITPSHNSLFSIAGIYMDPSHAQWTWQTIHLTPRCVLWSWRALATPWTQCISGGWTVLWKLTLKPSKSDFFVWINHRSSVVNCYEFCLCYASTLFVLHLQFADICSDRHHSVWLQSKLYHWCIPLPWNQICPWERHWVFFYASKLGSSITSSHLCTSCCTWLDTNFVTVDKKFFKQQSVCFPQQFFLPGILVVLTSWSVFWADMTCAECVRRKNSGESGDIFVVHVTHIWWLYFYVNRLGLKWCWCWPWLLWMLVQTRTCLQSPMSRPRTSGPSPASSWSWLSCWNLSWKATHNHS